MMLKNTVPITKVNTIPVIANPFEILEYCIALPSLSFLFSFTAQCHIKKATEIPLNDFPSQNRIFLDQK